MEIAQHLYYLAVSTGSYVEPVTRAECPIPWHHVSVSWALIDIDGVDRRLILRQFRLSECLLPARANFLEVDEVLQAQSFIRTLQVPAADNNDALEPLTGSGYLADRY